MPKCPIKGLTDIETRMMDIQFQELGCEKDSLPRGAGRGGLVSICYTWKQDMHQRNYIFKEMHMCEPGEGDREM